MPTELTLIRTSCGPGLGRPRSSTVMRLGPCSTEALISWASSLLAQMSKISHTCSAVCLTNRLYVNEQRKSDMVYAQMSSSQNPYGTAPQWKGPAELVIAASVARRYYMDGLK